MNDSRELAAELYSLWEVGAITLPNVAAVYAQGSRDVNNTTWRAEAAFVDSMETFTMPGPIDATVTKVNGRPVEGAERTADEEDTVKFEFTSPVFGEWSALRDIMQQVLCETSRRLVATGEALIRIQEQYAATDAEAAAELERERQELLNDTTYQLPKPPQSIPEAKAPGDEPDLETVSESLFGEVKEPRR